MEGSSHPQRVTKPSAVETKGSKAKMGWASNADEDAFGASATRRDVSGKDARHARTEKGPPPKRTMTMQEGRDYIHGIVLKWLEWLRNQP